MRLTVRGTPSEIVARATSRALNRAIDAANTALVRGLAADLGITQRGIRAGLTVDHSTPGRLEAAIRASGRRIPLIEFHARGPEPSRGRGRGVTYRLPGGRGRVASGFIATMRSGHRGVFKRRTKKRLPIVELLGPSLPFVATRRKIRDAIVAVGQAAFKKNLAHELRFAFRGGRAA